MKKKLRKGAYGVCARRFTMKRKTPSYRKPSVQKKRPSYSRPPQQMALYKPPAETKWFDINNTLSAIPDAATGNTTRSLFFPILGTDYNQRIGRQTAYKHIRVKGFFGATNGSITEPFGWIEVALVLDRQPNGALPTLGDVFATSTAVVSATGVLYPNPINRKRFKVLRTQCFNTPQIVWAGAGVITSIDVIDQNETMKFDWFIDCTKWKLRDQRAFFNATNGASGADLVENGLVWLAWTGNVAGTTAASWDLVTTSRVAYTDA